MLTANLLASLPGVGEALRREIAGLALVSGLLWGFARWACVGFDLTNCLNRPCWAKPVIDRASILSIRAVFCRRHQLLPRQQLYQCKKMGSQVASPAAESVIRYVWRAFHAAALCDFGGALGC